MKLRELTALTDEKHSKAQQQERQLHELELKLTQQSRDLKEREEKLQITLNRIANNEKEFLMKNEMLLKNENVLKKREIDNNIKENEFLMKQQEIELWEKLLQEKEMKLRGEQSDCDAIEARLQILQGILYQFQMRPLTY